MPITKQIEDASCLLGQSIEALAKLQNPEVTKALADLEEANRMLTGVLKEVTGERSLTGHRPQLDDKVNELSNDRAFNWRRLSVESIQEGLLELYDKLGDETLSLKEFRDTMRASILLNKGRILGSLAEALVKSGCIVRVRDGHGLRYRLTDEFKDAVTKYKLER